MGFRAEGRQMSLWQSGAFRPLLAFSRTTRLPELKDVPIARELTQDPKALSLIAFAEAPFYMALPIAAPPGPCRPSAPKLAGRLHGHVARTRPSCPTRKKSGST